MSEEKFSKCGEGGVFKGEEKNISVEFRVFGKKIGRRVFKRKIQSVSLEKRKRKLM